MRLMDIERQIKELIATNPDDPNIYSLIYRLCKLYLMRYRKVNNEESADEVANLMASDLFYKRTEIYSWCGYIKNWYMQYINKWKKEYQKEIVDCVGKPKREEVVIRMSCASAIDDHSIGNICMKSVMQGIPYLVNKALDASTYYVDTKEWLNAKLSLYLSLLHNRYISYNQTEENEGYTRMLYRAIMDEIENELYSDEDRSLSVMKKYALEDFSTETETFGDM